jgi:hypothetical protein
MIIFRAAPVHMVVYDQATPEAVTAALQQVQQKERDLTPKGSMNQLTSSSRRASVTKVETPKRSISTTNIGGTLFEIILEIMLPPIQGQTLSRSASQSSVHSVKSDRATPTLAKIQAKSSKSVAEIISPRGSITGSGRIKQPSRPGSGK